MELPLIITIIALLGYIDFREYLDRKERSEASKERNGLVNAIIAKTHQELLNLKMIDNSQPQAEDDAPKVEDTSVLTDKEFIEMETSNLKEE